MRSSFRIGRLSSVLIVPLVLLGCNSLNPLCRSARPAPALTSISPTTVEFTQLPSSLIITATGSHFVASSEVIFNGTIFAATVVSSTQLTVSIPSSAITAPGGFSIEIRTPAGNTGDLGCVSGGTSTGQLLTVTSL